MLGSLREDTEDIQGRKQFFISSKNRLNHIWIRKNHVGNKLCPKFKECIAVQHREWCEKMQKVLKHFTDS